MTLEEAISNPAVTFDDTAKTHKVLHTFTPYGGTGAVQVDTLAETAYPDHAMLVFGAIQANEFRGEITVVIAGRDDEYGNWG